jgi:tetratricopeptide (TPR) repeat protein
MIAREIGDRRGEGIRLSNLGLAYAGLGDARKAIEHHEQALLISREIGYLRGEGNALYNMSLSLDALGPARPADRACKRSAPDIRADRKPPYRAGAADARGVAGIRARHVTHELLLHYLPPSASDRPGALDASLFRQPWQSALE